MIGYDKVRETRLWEWLRDGTTLLTGLHMDRVDAEDQADVHGCLRGGAFWVELKTEERPKRDSTPIKVGLTSGQVDWLRARGAAGAFAWVLVQVGSGGHAARYLIWHAHADLIRRGAVERELRTLSGVDPWATAESVVLRASGHLFGEPKGPTSMKLTDRRPTINEPEDTW